MQHFCSYRWQWLLIHFVLTWNDHALFKWKGASPDQTLKKNETTPFETATKETCKHDQKHLNLWKSDQPPGNYKQTEAPATAKDTKHPFKICSKSKGSNTINQHTLWGNQSTKQPTKQPNSRSEVELSLDMWSTKPHVSPTEHKVPKRKGHLGEVVGEWRGGWM